MIRPSCWKGGRRRRLLRGADWRTCGYCGVARPVGQTRPLRDLRRYRESGEAICERCAAIAVDPAMPLPDIGWGTWDYALWLTVAQRIKFKSHRLAYWGTEKAAERARERRVFGPGSRRGGGGSGGPDERRGARAAAPRGSGARVRPRE